MNFIEPLALFASALAGLIVLMYLLKLRRQKEQVSSTLLWQKTIEDLIANAPFQKLRQNLLMYIQILALLAIVIALARPTMWLDTRVEGHRMILIDNSASMNAKDGKNGKTRLEEAKSVATELVANMRNGEQALIATFGGPPRVLQPFTVEKATLTRSIDSIEPTEAVGQIHEALAMVRGVRKAVDNPKNPTQLTIVSDGALGFLGNLIQKDEKVDFFSVGQKDAVNRAIVAFDVRESFEHRGQAEVFAQVANYSALETVQVARCLIDGKQVSIKELTIPAHGQAGVIFNDLGASDQPRKLRIELANARDMLACDDAVQGVIRFSEKTRVLLVSKGNFFLERVLALTPGVVVARIDPEKFEPVTTYDVVVFDNFSPPKIGPGKYLFINAAPHAEGFSAGPKPLNMQAVLDWNRLHPITRYVELGRLEIAKVMDMKAPDWMTPLVEGEAVPLVLAGERQGFRMVCIPFDLFDSDWALQVSFPIFFSNAVNWLLGAGEGSIQAVQHGTGDMVRLEGLRLGQGEELEIKRLRDPVKTWNLAANPEGNIFFNQTLFTGFYDYSIGGKPRGSFAVNMISPGESNIEPIQALKTGERAVEAVTVARQNREIWPWLALAALALLVIEWHIYGRRSWL